MEWSLTVAEEREKQFQRLLNLTARLLGSNGLSVRDLGGHNDATRRRIQRDLNKLRECGLPLQSTEHDESVPRYRLDNLRLAGSQLDLEETLAVTLATLLVGKSDVGELARQGWNKLHYAVANGQERKVKADLPTHVSAQTAWALPKAQLKVISTALLEGRRLRLYYQGYNDSAPRWRLIEPWQLFFQDRWYIGAYDPAGRAPRISAQSAFTSANCRTRSSCCPSRSVEPTLTFISGTSLTASQSRLPVRWTRRSRAGSSRIPCTRPSE